MKIYNRLGIELRWVKKEEMDTWCREVQGLPICYAIAANEIFLYPEEPVEDERKSKA